MTAISVSKSRPGTPKSAPPAQPSPALPSTADTMPQLEAELARISHKNTNRLVDLHRRFITLSSAARIPVDGEKNADNPMPVIASRFHDLLTKNQDYQRQLLTESETALAELETFLKEGHSNEALHLWDRIQGNIGNTHGKIKSALRQKTAHLKSPLADLREWRKFAAAEKKKELLTQMKNLRAAKMDPADRARRVTELHNEWKALGKSSQNESLWKEFKKLSDQAYEPCKEYFRQRKRTMVENLKRRREICVQLEQYLESLVAENVNVTALNQIEKQARDEWKQFAPVPQSSIRELQKRFHGALDQMRSMRRRVLKANGQRKQELVEQATSVLSLEDNRQAMTEAKTLQARWKEVGPAGYREDKKFRKSFRSACDEVFEQGIGKRQKTARENSHSGEARNRAEPAGPTPDKRHAELAQQIAIHTEFYSQLEDQLMASSNDEALRQVRESINGAWDRLPAVQDSDCEEQLRSRYAQISALNSRDDLNRWIARNEAELREACIKLEIRAGLESPEEDQTLRMQLQLDQLKEKFGRPHPETPSRQLAGKMEKRLLCLGPLAPPVRSSLTKRLQSAVAKLN
ncbi:MAG: DUF349 domain-containing protein [Pseudohongiellaceae bacterium]